MKLCYQSWEKGSTRGSITYTLPTEYEFKVLLTVVRNGKLQRCSLKFKNINTTVKDVTRKIYKGISA
jgi:hypothetical protein